MHHLHQQAVNSPLLGGHKSGWKVVGLFPTTGLLPTAPNSLFPNFLSGQLLTFWPATLSFFLHPQIRNLKSIMSSPLPGLPKVLLPPAF